MSARQWKIEKCGILLDRLDAAGRETDRLFELLKPDDFYVRPIPHRHRMLFYLGHLEAFDSNLLAERLGFESTHREFDSLFAFGIDPGSENLPSESASAWPKISAIRHYARGARSELRAAVEAATSRHPKTHDTGLEVLLNVAIEHRLMHAETLAYLVNFLPSRGGRVADVDTRAGQGVMDTHPIRVPEGYATLGRGDDGEFGWDNEFGARRDWVPPFEIDRCMVSNADYLRFVQAEGYATRRLWTEENWQWRCAAELTHPAFWHLAAGQWYYRTVRGLIPLPGNWPVYVSHAEASAYAAWKSQSLPTEAQWHRAAYGTAAGKEREYPWGDEPPRSRHGNFDFHAWTPSAVNGHPQGASDFGVLGLLGNGWEWTRDVFAAFPGFEPMPFYKGYSADFFDGKHFVMKGGSARTAACMLRRSFRNWFQPHYPFVYAGFRCVSA